MASLVDHVEESGEVADATSTATVPDVFRPSDSDGVEGRVEVIDLTEKDVDEVRVGFGSGRKVHFFVVEAGRPEVRKFEMCGSQTMGALVDALGAEARRDDGTCWLLHDGRRLERETVAGRAFASIMGPFQQCRGSPYVLAVFAPEGLRGDSAGDDGDAKNGGPGVSLASAPEAAWVGNLFVRRPVVAYATATAFMKAFADAEGDDVREQRLSRCDGLGAALAECVGQSPYACARHAALQALVVLSACSGDVATAFVDAGGAGALGTYLAKADLRTLVAEGVDRGRSSSFTPQKRERDRERERARSV